MDLGNNIRLFRKVTGISQAELAKKLYVTPQAVSRWENNETEPGIDTLYKMAEIFGTDIDSLVNGDKSVINSIKAEKAYHLLCLAGGCFTTIFAVVFTAFMIIDREVDVYKTMFIVISLLFLISLFIFELRSKRLKRNRRDRIHKEKEKK